MSAENLNKLAEILLYCLLLTVVFSVLIMIGGKKIFKKANKNVTTALIPIINLFTMLEITETSLYAGILFFVPILNIIVIWIMFFRLGSAFNTGFVYKVGLVIFPVIFYPLLAFSNKQYKLADEEYFKLLDNVKKDNINLMTEDENKESNTEEYEETPKVDSIFKSDVEEKKAKEPYKAIRIDVLGLNKLKNNKNEEIIVKEKKDKKNNVEYLDL